MKKIQSLSHVTITSIKRPKRKPTRSHRHKKSVRGRFCSDGLEQPGPPFGTPKINQEISSSSSSHHALIKDDQKDLPSMPSNGQGIPKLPPSLSSKFPSFLLPSKIVPVVARSEKNDNNRLLPKSTSNFNADSLSTKEKSKLSCPQSVLSNNSIDLKQIETIGTQKQKNKNKKFQFPPMSLNLTLILLALLLILFLVISIVVPIVIITASTIGTASTLSTTINWNTTSSTSTTATSTTSTTASSTTGTTATTTTSTASTTAATVTITPNICTSSWQGISMVAYCEQNCTFFPVYYKYIYNYTAISSTTRIAFGMKRQNGYFGMDAVSTRNFLTPGTEILINGGFEFGNLSSWVYCAQDNTTNTGSVQLNSTQFTYLTVRYYAYEGSYYYIGGSTTATDYISQAFPTVIGNQYRISFAALVGSNGANTSGYFFLGV